MVEYNEVARVAGRVPQQTDPCQVHLDDQSCRDWRELAPLSQV